MSTMRGVVFEAKGRAVLRSDLERPTCGPGGLLLRTMRSGVTNGTERNCLLGGNYCPGFPNRTGYQLVAEIVECGEEVAGYAVGDIVYSGHLIGHLEYSAVPAADNLVVRLDQGIDLADAALFGVASVAMHDCRRVDVRVDERVLVVGLGLIGQLTAQACRSAGAVVVGSDPDPERRRIAAELGCDAVVDPTVAGAAADLGPYDAVFDNSGADVLPELIDLLCPRGRLALIAGRERVEYPFNAGQRKELTIVQASHFDKGDIRVVMRLVGRGAIRIAPLVRDVVPIDQAERIYATLRDDPARLLGTVFEWP